MTPTRAQRIDMITKCGTLLESTAWARHDLGLAVRALEHGGFRPAVRVFLALYTSSMSRAYPNTPGNLRTAVLGSLKVQSSLVELGIVCFEWPQSMDSGIDLVAFATYAEPSDVKLRATAFTAGIQVKGTADVFGEAESRKIYIRKHADYWETATMPVFVTAVSIETGAVLVEDAWSLLWSQRHLEPHERDLNAVPASTTLSLAGDHIRLRMMTHALAPYLSPRLRSRPLAQLTLPDVEGLESVWTAFASTADKHSSFANPRSWSEAQQLFEVLSHMLRDSSIRQEFSFEIARIRDLYRAGGATATSRPEDLNDDADLTAHGAPTVLTAAIEVLFKLGEFIDDRQVGAYRGIPPHLDDSLELINEALTNPDGRYKRIVVEAATDLIAEMWELMCDELKDDDLSPSDFLWRSSRGIREIARKTIATLTPFRERAEVARELRLIFRDEANPDFAFRHW